MAKEIESPRLITKRLRIGTQDELIAFIDLRARRRLQFKSGSGFALFWSLPPLSAFHLAIARLDPNLEIVNRAADDFATRRAQGGSS